MRLWTLHPKYLDPQGLVALWREALLAQKVLQGETSGYRHHSQLRRFQTHSNPLGCIADYLRVVSEEADRRGYHFNKTKIISACMHGQLEETSGQLMYEWEHLGRKLAQRSPALLTHWQNVRIPEPHPLFRIVPGEVREWELKISARSTKQ